MVKFNKFAERCLKKAKVYAKRDNECEIRISYVIYSILNDKKTNFAIDILEELNVDVDLLIKNISNIMNISGESTETKKTLNYSGKLEELLDFAKSNMIPLEGKKETSVEDIFYATMFIENELSDIFRDFSLESNSYKETALELDGYIYTIIDEEEIYDIIENTTDIKKSKHTKNEVLDKYCTNLNKLAIEGELDSCFGRNNEMKQLYRILSRTKKSNPVLIGEAGVGKTNIIDGFVNNIINGDAPDNLKSKTVYSLNLTSVVAGTKYRGQFEERIQIILNELTKNKNSILFIDEIHNIMGAGHAEGSLDLSNILKPYISRNTFQIIGATTLNEYKKRIEKDKALKRRFGEIHVKEPNIDTCIEIINKIKPSFEKAHGVKYTPEAVNACVKLSHKYITYRTLPDKAIDLLDDVAAKVKLEKHDSENLKKLQNTYKKIEEIKKQIIETKTYEKAEVTKNESNKILIKIKKEKTKINKLLKEKILITEEHVKSLIEEITKIPLSNDGINISNLKSNLENNIIGQNDAIKSIVKTLMINQLNLGDEGKPIGSFMFVGYSGVGKTQLAKELTKNLFGDEQYLVRLDCSEYSQKHEVSKLIGSPAGYVGYNEGGILTETIKRNPFSIILFDEIEKAHDKLFDILLQILGEGRLTDNQGETIDFKNTIIILTSNVGTKQAIKNNSRIGFDSNLNSYDKNIIHKSLKKRFRPEFINRIDNIVHFNILSKSNLLSLLDIHLEKLTIEVAKHGVSLKISQNVKSLLVDEAYIPENGFRALKRKINDELKLLVAEELMSEEKPTEISLVVRNKKVKVK